MTKKTIDNIKKILGIFILIFIVNYLANKYRLRWDLTADNRYTLSKTTHNLLDNIENNLSIKVYLKGDFPSDFKRLQQETKQHLNELKAINSNIHFQFINPSSLEEKLINEGLQPSRLTIEEEGLFSEKIIFPWAVIKYKKKKTLVPLLIETGSNQKEQLQNSIENLEYIFSKAITEVIYKKTKTIAVLKGNGEPNDIYLFDFLSSLKEKYRLAPFTLNKLDEEPQKTLSDLKKYDLAIIIKPTQAFSEEQKLILDQYIINGGKTLWMIDNTTAEMDSLHQTGEALFTPRELHLTDLLFSYGVRINYNLVEDLYSSKIAIATGNIGNKTQFKQFLWRYYPLITPNTQHPISKKIEPVNLRFPSDIDTLKNGIRKTILLQSSALTKTTGLPAIVSLSSIAENIRPEAYNIKPKNLGVLLEGEFKSAYQHRTKAFNTDFKDISPQNKMIVIADGDIALNQIKDGQALRMDLDTWTGQHFGNKDFILNAVDYLLDDIGLIDLRSKSLDIKTLNREKIKKEKKFWQFINIILPLLLLGLSGMVFTYYRKREFS
jgi:gliding-associated putative ABC transporter substrate-binding component GldG